MPPFAPKMLNAGVSFILTWARVARKWNSQPQVLAASCSLQKPLKQTDLSTIDASKEFQRNQTSKPLGNLSKKSFETLKQTLKNYKVWKFSLLSAKV